MNKIDLTEAAAGVARDEYGKIKRVFLSAKTGIGLDSIRMALTEFAHERGLSLAAAHTEMEDDHDGLE